MLFVLAIIPVIGLLCFIYFNDKKEKEPFGLLVALFFAGMATVLTAMVAELAGGFIIESVSPEKTVLSQIVDAMIIVGPAEELGKFFVLWIITWKNKHFNYSYDAIVYAVFVSLGFAAFENVGYVFSNGVGTAIARMITAVPGHACFAVFMGFFYSKAKYAAITQKKGKCLSNILLAIFVPIVIHGIYDAILMGAGASDLEALAGISIILWLGFVIAMFVVSCIIIVKSSKNDFCIVTMPDKVQTIYRPAVVGNWTCTCGSVNRLNFCPKCGRQREFVSTWYCSKCGAPSSLNFCGNCGSPKPVYQTPAQNNV
ncbi:MAG: PrsW family intramembrane metalloprotease [Saccharofermentans sp.]|nr:PrsW family intramembrane metalloprotease [Saccharofermentans sp.]